MFSQLYVVRTFSSGASNSMRGASFLANIKDGKAIVIDVGGTTTDIGMIENGFPKSTSTTATIAGVR